MPVSNKMDKKLEKAIERTLTTCVYAYFPLSDLAPPIEPNFIALSADEFKVVLFDDETGHMSYNPQEAENVKEDMIKQLKEDFKSRNIIVEITGEVVQEFVWNGVTYDLDDHDVSYAVLLKCKIIEKIGSIYKNTNDFSAQYLETVLDSITSITNINSDQQ